MAADLHIHVLDGISGEDLASFFSNTLGSKYFNPRPGGRASASSPVSQTPNVWIGEVSWLKAAFLGDSETYVPASVVQISDLIGEDLPELTEELLTKILDALGSKNTTNYSISSRDDVESFLREHMGKRLFTVSW